jgi:hypothetical protein
LDGRFDTQACQSAADDSSREEQMLDFVSLLQALLERFRGLLTVWAFVTASVLLAMLMRAKGLKILSVRT